MKFWPWPWKTGRQPTSSSKAERRAPDAVEKAASDLVQRARFGEQNATAQLVVLGEQYRAGPDALRQQGGDWARVKRSYETVHRYLSAHPPPEKHRDPFTIAMPDFRGTDSEPAGPAIPREARRALREVAGFGADPKGLYALTLLPALGGLEGVTCAVVLLANGPTLRPEDFVAGQGALGSSFAESAEKPDLPPADEKGFAGFVFGRAARIQAVRAGGSLGLLGPGVAWEVGQ